MPRTPTETLGGFRESSLGSVFTLAATSVHGRKDRQAFRMSTNNLEGAEQVSQHRPTSDFDERFCPGVIYYNGCNESPETHSLKRESVPAQSGSLFYGTRSSLV